MNWLGPQCYRLAQYQYMALSISMQVDKGLKSLVLPVLLYGCKTWTLNSDLEKCVDALGTKCLSRIMQSGASPLALLLKIDQP